MSRRTQRIDSLLHRAVQEVISRGLNDPRAEGMITVTGVRVDDHLGSAVVTVSMLPDKKLPMAVKALEHAARHIRREAAEIAGLHRMPNLTFRADTTPARQREVLEAIAKGRAEFESREAKDEAGLPGAPGAPGAPEALDEGAPQQSDDTTPPTDAGPTETQA